MDWLAAMIFGGIAWGGWESIDSFSKDKIGKGIIMAIITFGFISLLIWVPALREAL